MCTALGLVGAADVGSGVHLMQLLGDLVASGVHLFGALFLQSNDLLEQSVTFVGQLCTRSAFGRRTPRAAVWVLCVIRFQLSFQRLKCRDPLLLSSQQLEQRPDLAVADEVGLAATNIAQLRQHLMLL